MPWFNNFIPESIKKSVCSCLIKRYLNHFIENEIKRDQLNLDLYNGRATAERISLAVEALNELGESQNWPIEFVDGYIEKIHITVPWTAIFSESTQVEICGLKITVQPKQRKEDATSMFESMWNSMTSSMHLAEEFAKEEAAKKDTNTPAFEGIELFAQTIDTVVRKIKVKFIDTKLQIEHLPRESDKGVGLLINIDLMEYYDDFSTVSSNNEDTLDPSKPDSEKAYLVDAFTTKNIILKGIQLSTVEFSSEDRTVSRSLIKEDSKDFSKEEETFFDAAEADDIKETEKNNESSELNDEVNLRHVILCGKCFNTQEVKIRLKQSENIYGPKVAIELNLGSLIMFFSSRQFHIMLELIDGFSSPDLEDNSNVLHKNHPQPRPMTEKDYERVEEQLGNITNNKFQAFNLLHGHGWSSGDLDESSDSQYFPMQEANNSAMYDSSMSGFSSSMDSSITSSMISSMTENTRHRRRAYNINADPTAEISHFQIRIATLAVILLHEDLLANTTGNEKVLVWQMQSMADKFFKNIDYNTFTGIVSDGFDQVHKSLKDACSLNHLRLLASPVKLEANETTTSSAFWISGDLTASKFEVSECLYNSGFKQIPIISFRSPQNSYTPSIAIPNLGLKFKHLQRSGKSAGIKKNGPKTELSVHLDECSVEFDISIIDRISCLLYQPPISRSPKMNVNKNQRKPLQVSSVKSLEELKLFCPVFNFKIRFPIPDFRPATDMSKVPWWERNVRSDYLLLTLHDTKFHTMFETDQIFNEYTVECKMLDIFYYESENSCGLHLAKSGKNEAYLSSIQGNPTLTKLSIQIYPKKLEEDGDIIPDPMKHSFYGAFENQGNPEPGPFGAKKVVHESDTPHSKQRKHDSEEQVIPGDKAELENFIETTTANAQILVKLTLPIISVQLESKHIYELIYNRINNDLLLWQSQAPKPSISPLYMQFGDMALDQQFIVANSGFQFESDSDSGEDDDNKATEIFYSTYDSKIKRNIAKSVMAPQIRNSQSNFVLSLNIYEGMLSLNPPVRDSTGNVIPGQQGELLLNLSNANVFIVSGYKGDSDLGYVCVQVKNAQLHHCDIQPIVSTNLPLRDVGAILGHQLFPTIYKSDEKALACSKNKSGDREMFTVALKIQANHETHHVKVVTVSLGLNQATLRHKMGRQPNTWISHILDFFNVQDYPIPGYVPKDVMTELHLHLWDCAIDYRPLHLPLRSVITIGSFNMSSHLSAVANTSTLTLIFEDCGLFLSEKTPPRDGVASNVRVDLQRDYVNVVEISLFEISIKTTDKQSGINPHIDLRTSINMLSIRTCSDSGRALLKLLTYFINDGDLNPEPQSEDIVNSSPKHETDEELLSIEQKENTLSKSQQDLVSELLEEAIQESPKSDKDKDVPPFSQVGTKLFYFPDELEVLEELPTQANPQVIADLGKIDLFHFGGKEIEIDDDFCFVGDDAMLPKDGVPEITWFSQGVKIIENHVSKPNGKRDILAPPKGFPTPVTRYTLCDMSIIWQMYGGNDFKKKEDKKKEVRFAEKQFNDRVTFSNTQHTVNFSQADDSRTKDLSWIERGGVGRDHSLLMELQLSKVRFSYEVYPDTTRQASRQVLSIYNVEIRDRLASSQINKFLYQFSSQSLPKQSHSNMVVIKALHSRPDPKLKREECDLKISLLPIRLNIDQDSLFFMINFFKELSGERVDESNDEAPKDSSMHSTPTHQPPIMTVSVDNEEEIKQQAKKVVNENLILLESRYHVEAEESSDANVETVTDNAPIYFRQVEFLKDVLIRLDYVGKRVDMTHGSIAGLLMGLFYLNCSEIRLKRLVHRHGLLGFNKLVAYLLQEWITDIKKNQLSNILGGVGPMKAVLQLFHGVIDLFWLPIQQYQKDGRIVRGLQRGANSFTTSTAMAALELTTRLIYFIQITAETAYDMLSPGPSIRMKRLKKREGRRRRYHQPQDIREGLTNACLVVKEGIGETADNILQVAALEKEQKGISGAVGAVIRQIPSTIVKPVHVGAEALTNVLGGMRSQLVPDARKEANEKWRSNL